MAMRWTIKEVNYDSVLTPAHQGHPAKLTLRLKVNLFPRDPSRQEEAVPRGGDHHGFVGVSVNDVHTGRVKDGDGIPFECRSWTYKEFNEFKIKFKRMVELSWNNQLILLPPDGSDGDGLSDHDYLQFVSSPQVPAHVECALDVELLAENQRSSPILIEVLHLKNRENHKFRSFAYLITNEDVEFTSSRDYRWPSLPLNQVTVAHELGHWLGQPTPSKYDPKRVLQHVDHEYCSKLPEDQDGDDTKSDCGYGHVGEKRMALMGAGSVVTEYESKPWLYRIQRHTHALFGWKMIHRVHFNAGKAQVSDRQQQLTSGSGRH